MSETHVLPLGDSGLVKADLSLRFYRDGASTPSDVTPLTVTELAGRRYRIAGLPTLGRRTWGTLTAEHPPGVGHAHRYPEQKGAPPNVIVPVRESGLIAADLNLRISKDGVDQAVTFTAAEVGSPGDYRVAGWPRDESGSWVLSWERSGFLFSTGWQVLTSRFIEILAVQRPFPFNLDDSGRTMFSCNFNALAAGPLGDWEGELAALLADAGLAAYGSGTAPPDDTFIGPIATLPAGVGPYVRILDTGGRAPDETHGGKRYERLSAQIVVSATDFDAGKSRALAIWRELDGKRNLTVAAA